LKKATISGIPAKNTMVMPCMVKSWLYRSGLIRPASGAPSCARRMSASSPAARKKRSAVTK
jgi:hypothetical protein